MKGSPPSDATKFTRAHEPGDQKGRRTMKHIRMRAQPDPNASRYTHLSACVSEEDGAFTVQVRLYDEAKPEKGVWGEETAQSIEAASVMLGELAATYSIPQARINIRVRMANPREGTRH